MDKPLFHSRPGRPARGYDAKSQVVYMHPLLHEKAKTLAVLLGVSFPRLIELALVRVLEAKEEAAGIREGSVTLAGEARPRIRSLVPFGSEVAKVYTDAEKRDREELEKYRAEKRAIAERYRAEEVEEAKRRREAIERERLERMEAEVRANREKIKAGIERQRQKAEEDRRREAEEEAEAAATEEQARIVANVEMRRRIVEGDEDLL